MEKKVPRGERSINYAKYEHTLSRLKEFLQEELGQLAIGSAIIFGSSVMGTNYFKEGVSDIDICAFSPNMQPDRYDEIVSYIGEKLKHDTSDKPPVLLRDHTADRIEFFMDFPDIKIDMNILPPGLPGVDRMHQTAAHDNLDLLYSNFYKYSVNIIGDTVPLAEEMNEIFAPFYDDEIRHMRLDTLTARIVKANERVEDNIKRGLGVFDDVHKSRSYFMKWLFIYKRVYPISLTKHVGLQLAEFLDMDGDEIDTIQFSGEASLRESTTGYINLSNQYIKQYERGK